MPELPEVETIRRWLDRRLRGRRIVRVEVREGRLRRPLGRDFPRLLEGDAVVCVGRRGKYLCLHLQSGRLWVVHLGMTGRLILGRRFDGAPEAGDHECVTITLSTGLCLRYADVRRFGLMLVAEPQALAELRALGPEPLGRDFTPAYLATRCRGTRRAIRDVLMDQSVVAGIGNIYANEALFRAGVRPGRSARRLTRAEIRRVVKKTREVLREAIRRRGSSISDYRDGRGRKGAFQRSFSVYGRAGQPCPICSTPVKRIVRTGRSAFYCPRCQI
jgi:formamidopyrimidine-DNA glycosylase